jgi:FeS assembly SUF system regulator
MVRFSRLADYAVLLMTHMANERDGVHNAIDMAAATGLPVPTVSKVLAILGRRGLLESQRGAKGGYVLARGAAEISVAEIVGALDGPIALTHCIKSGPGSCDVEPVCPSRYSLHRINERVQSALAGITLAEIAAPPPAWAAFLPPGPAPSAG